MQFPERTNVIFIRVRDRANIEERIWERGVGETESSGTCSCAAVVASVVNELTDRTVDVHAPGGVIPIEWRADGFFACSGPDFVLRVELDFRVLKRLAGRRHLIIGGELLRQQPLDTLHVTRRKIDG